MRKNNKQPILLGFPLIVASQVLILYSFISIILEYFLTEKFLLLAFLDNSIKLVLLFFIFIIIFLINFYRPRLNYFWIKNSNFFLILILLLIISIFSKKAFAQYYQNLQKYPRILDISQNRSIQGTIIKVKGKNFGHPYEAGSVTVQGQEMIINSWDNQTIIFTQPLVNHFFTGNLQVINSKKYASNPVKFTLKNPAEL